MKWRAVFWLMIVFPAQQFAIADNTTDIEVLSSLVCSESSEVASLACNSLGDYGERLDLVIPILLGVPGAAFEEENRELDEDHMEREGPGDLALRKIGTAAIPHLMNALHDDDDRLVSRVIRTLAYQHAYPSLEFLHPHSLLKRLRDLKLRSLLLHDARRAISVESDLILFYQSSLEDDDDLIVSESLQLIRELGPHSGPLIPQILTLVHDQRYYRVWISNHFSTEDSIRRLAIRTLGELRARQAIPLFECELFGRTRPYRRSREGWWEQKRRESERKMDRAVIAMALLKIQPDHDQARSAIVSTLRGREDAILNRAMTIDAIESLGAEAAWLLPELRPLLRHKNPQTRLQVIETVCKIGGPDAIPLIRTGLRDRSRKVRSVTLGYFPTPAAEYEPLIPDLCRILSRPGAIDYLDQDRVLTLLLLFGPSARPAIPAIRAFGQKNHRNVAAGIVIDCLERGVALPEQYMWGLPYGDIESD